MPQLPENLPDSGFIFRLVDQSAQLQRIFTAVELGLFECLASPRSLEEAARTCSLQQPGLEIFLDLLRSLGLIAFRDGLYQNTPESDSLYLKNSYANILPMLREFQQMISVPLNGLADILRHGPQISNREELNMEAMYGDEEHSSLAWAARGAGSDVAALLNSLPGSENFQTMLDMGGGHGLFALYAAEAMPGLTAWVMDFPAVLEQAEKQITRWNMPERVRLKPGNYMRDPLGGPYDVILACCTLNFTVPDGKLDDVMRKACEALKPGGWLVSLHGEPDGAALDDAKLYSLLSGRDITLPDGAIARSMLENGFRHVRTRSVMAGGVRLSLDLAHKK